VCWRGHPVGALLSRLSGEATCATIRQHACNTGLCRPARVRTDGAWLARTSHRRSLRPCCSRRTPGIVVVHALRWCTILFWKTVPALTYRGGISMHIGSRVAGSESQWIRVSYQVHPIYGLCVPCATTTCCFISGRLRWGVPVTLHTRHMLQRLHRVIPSWPPATNGRSSTAAARGSSSSCRLLQDAQPHQVSQGGFSGGSPRGLWVSGVVDWDMVRDYSTCTSAFAWSTFSRVCGCTELYQCPPDTSAQHSNSEPCLLWPHGRVQAVGPTPGG